MQRYMRPAVGLPPFQQGSLDSLCGLYSIVNAERFINRSVDEEAQMLFNDIVYYLSRRQKLAYLLSEGIIHKQMLQILNRVVGKKRISRVCIPWRGLPNPDLTAFWRSMQDFLDGTPGRAIILGPDDKPAFPDPPEIRATAGRSSVPSASTTIRFWNGYLLWLDLITPGPRG